MILTVYFLLYAGAKELLRRRAEKKKENECKPNIRLRAPMQKCRSDVFLNFPVNSKKHPGRIALRRRGNYVAEATRRRRRILKITKIRRTDMRLLLAEDEKRWRTRWKQCLHITIIL